MKNALHSTVFLIVFASLLGLSDVAQSATITFTDGDNAMQSLEIGQTLELGLFDTSLGILNSITLTLGTSYESVITVVNTAADTTHANGTLAMQVYYSSTLEGLDYFLWTGVADYWIGEITETVDVPGGAEGFALPTLSGSMFSVNDANMDFGWFMREGGGGFTIDCHSLSNIAPMDDLDALIGTDNTTAKCSGSITYDYLVDEAATDPLNVPEPASLGLVGIGLLGMVWRRRGTSSASRNLRYLFPFFRV